MSQPLNGKDDGHDKGLVFDLKTLRLRRQTWALIWVRSVGAFLAERQFGAANGGETTVAGTRAGGARCIKNPTQTVRPYPGDGTNAKYRATANALADGWVVRRDLCNSFAGMTQLAQRVPVELVPTQVTVSGVCARSVGHAVYQWYCDAEGHYSLNGRVDRI